jgi:hypothetical protein
MVLLLFAGACRCSKPQATGAASEDAVQPVYAGSVDTPDPGAVELCQALHGFPEERRAACCGGAPGRTLRDECVRVVSLALAAGDVVLDRARAGACVGAQQAAFDGCGWVGPSSPTLPEACQVLTVGKLERGARCRSSLECTDGLRCRGLGPTQPGVCDAPGKPSTACDLGADPLAVYLLQDNRAHPECSGTCVRRTCVAAAAVGQPCTFAGQCGQDAHCAAGRCVAERFAQEGEPCIVGACDPRSVCHQGVCVRRQREGASCESDEECLGACVHPDGGRGVCGMRCPG